MAVDDAHAFRPLRLTVVAGDLLESNWRHPMFEIIRDDVGRNDIITSMCDDRRYRLDYKVEGHRSCRTNFTEALEPWGIAEWQIPDPFNFFQNAPIHPDRTFGNEIPTGQPAASATCGVRGSADGAPALYPSWLN